MATTEKGIYYPDNYEAVADVPKDLRKLAESVEKTILENQYNDSKIKEDITNLQDNSLIVEEESEVYIDEE